jgi:hypothetical protein
VSVERVKCTECDHLILPETAVANHGLCAPCAKTPESLRRAKREYEDKLSSGSWFTPSREERGTAKRPAEFGDAAATWSPEPEHHRDLGVRSAREAISLATGQSTGHVFLVSDRGGRLSLAFNEVFGVCEYQNEGTGDFLYAYTPENLTEQVPGDRHLLQACSCCGVGLLWYPSRFHTPRQTAFAVFSALALGDAGAAGRPVEWLTCGDISYTARGRG